MALPFDQFEVFDALLLDLVGRDTSMFHLSAMSMDRARKNVIGFAVCPRLRKLTSDLAGVADPAR
jgi:hypothetical protein